MKPSAFRLFLSLLVGFSLEVQADNIFVPGQLLFEREGNDVDFPGGSVGPSNVDGGLGPGGFQSGDPNTYVTPQLNIDNNVGGNTYNGGPNMDAAGLPNLSGDGFEMYYTFQFYDADGDFSFFEDMDDQTHVDVVPIADPFSPAATGPAMSHSNTHWNDNAYGDFSFGAGGWFSTSVRFVENGGGAGQAQDSHLGFGFYNDTVANNFAPAPVPTGGANGGGLSVSGGFPAIHGGIGYNPSSAASLAVFDVDPFTGFSFGSILVVPEPSRALLLLAGTFGLILRRRR